MSLRLIQRINEINIEDIHQLKVLEIDYGGSFIAELQENASVIITRKKIKIYFKEVPQSDVLMKYYGNFRIKS